MLSLALAGKNISHSRSKFVYEKLLNEEVDYYHYDCDASELLPSLEEVFKSYKGLSITAPYKRHYLDRVSIDEEVRPLEAINCIKKVEDGFQATNTDYMALKEIFQKRISSHHSVVILGDGAMGKVTEHLFGVLKIPYKVFSRKKDDHFFDIDFGSLYSKEDKLFLINACSRKYFYNKSLAENSVFYDYNYSSETQASYIQSLNNVQYVDGMELLEGQALYALKFWGIVE
ncbi:MAG: hypothetical protein ACPGJV_09075 [Bacteriovoracaceae bacterium]